MREYKKLKKTNSVVEKVNNEAEYSPSLTKKYTLPIGDHSKWGRFNEYENNILESSIARLANCSSVSHKTINAMLATLAEFFIKIEGNDTKAELRAITRMLGTYVGEAPDYKTVGQLAAGGFTCIMNEARRNHCSSNRRAQEPIALREKATVFYNLIHSDYFKDSLEKVVHSKKLQLELRDIINVKYLKKKKINRRNMAYGNDKTRRLNIYDYKNENSRNSSDNVLLYEETKIEDDKIHITNPAKRGGSLTGSQSKYRQKSAGKYKPWASLYDLYTKNRLTKRELGFILTNPEYQSLSLCVDKLENNYESLKKVKVLRDYGIAVWEVKDNSGFALDAAINNKPVVSGPSGTTDRFISATRVIGNGVIRKLGLDLMKKGETRKQCKRRSVREMKELVRWMATGFLVEDLHHSMLEVNLAAANHGLHASWDTRLYTKPFSHPIESSEISTHDLLTELSNADVPESWVNILRNGSGLL